MQPASELVRMPILLSFAIVYLVWGSTYLGIRIAVETMPPFFLTAVRFLVAGTVLLLYAWCRGITFPTLKQWKSSMIIGLCLSVLGNGLVVFAEQRIPSSIAALLIPSVAIWLTIFAWLFVEREAPSSNTLKGLFFGCIGVLMLSYHSLTDSALQAQPIDIAAMLLATFAWAVGTVYTRNADLPSSPVMMSAAQMFCGGIQLVGLSLLNGEWQTLDPSKWSTNSLWALAYLIVFGSIAAFSAYMYLAKRVPPQILGSYAFVNPIIALFLGAWLYQEPLSATALLSAACILLGVVYLLLGKSPTTSKRRLSLFRTQRPARS